jgi:transcriptional regulator with XRE-family HTH domain
MLPGSPKPGDIGRLARAGSEGLQHSEILEMRGPRAESLSRWAERMNARAEGRVVCSCGCGEPIEVLPSHHSKGVPRYRPGHHPNPITRAYSTLREERLMTIREVCRNLGVGQTTLRRYEAEGWLPPLRRRELLHGRSIRVFTDEDLHLLRRALEEKRRAASLVRPLRCSCGRALVGDIETLPRGVRVHHDRDGCHGRSQGAERWQPRDDASPPCRPGTRDP